MTHAPLTLERARPEDPRIRYAIHRPSGEPRRAVLAHHGYNEHSGRYREVCERWTAKGLLVATYDLRGHGVSEGPRGRVERFDDYVRDAEELLSKLAQDDAWRACGKPVLFGHSMGGLVATHVALAGAKGSFRGLALSSPYFGLLKDPPLVVRLFARTMSRLAPSLGAPSGLSGKDLTRSEAIAKAYDEDPYAFKNANTRWFVETVAAQERALARAHELTLPVFCLCAGDDRLVSTAASRRFVDATSAQDKTHRALPGLFHEIMNEPERVPVIDELADKMLEW